MIEEIDRDKLREEIKDSISRQWEVQARAAGWSPPISSKLRVVEKVVLENDSADRMQPSLYSGHRSRVLDEPTRTITRLLTPEETNEVAEECELMHRENGQALTLISGARVILVEDNDVKR
jgi:hypothetical protein